MGDETLLWVPVRAADVPDDDLWLSDDEQGVLAGLSFAPRRRDWRLGRWAAKQAVAAWLGPCWPTAEIIAAADGAPEAFVEGRPAPVAISLTHRSGLAVCVAGPDGGCVGCDLEAVEPRSVTFLRDWFTPEEALLIERATPGERALMTTIVWSAKESALKVLREGLRLDTRDVVVLPGDQVADGWTDLEVEYTDGGVRMRGSWRLHAGHVLTIVAQPGDSVFRRIRAAPSVTS